MKPRERHSDAAPSLPSRQRFRTRLDCALASAAAAGRLVGLLYFDLDRFKTINDSFGHAAADELLDMVSQRLERRFRGSARVSRLGGDDFAILLEGLDDHDQALAVMTMTAQSALLAVARPLRLHGHELSLSASIGAAVAPLHGRTADTLMANADAAMYTAKEAGRGILRVYSHDMNARAKERLLLGNRLRRAIDNEELRLHYQPQVDARSGRITGVEALLRWQQTPKHLASPAEFLEAAEDNGLVLPLGQWVLRTALEQLATWRRAGLPPVRVAVNVNAREFRDPELAGFVARTLAAADVRADALELELTETSILSVDECTRATFDALAAMGVGLAIDDFGTGYATFRYLRELPVDALKIDRSFVADLTRSERDRAIVAAMLSMAQSLGIRTIAEGVETAAQADILCRQGCRELQGFRFGRPSAADALEPLLRTGTCR